MHKVKDVLYAVKSGFPPFPRKVFGGRIVLSVLQKIEPSKTRPLIWRVWCMYGVCMVYVPFQLAKTIFGRKKEVAEQGHPDPSRTTMTTMNLKSLMCPKSGRRGRRKKKKTFVHLFTGRRSVRMCLQAGNRCASDTEVDPTRCLARAAASSCPRCWPEPRTTGAAG